MLSCKNKLFKKLLLFSFLFLIFSIFCNKILHAEANIGKATKTSTHHVQVEQKKIISSLKKIEDCIDTQKEVF